MKRSTIDNNNNNNRNNQIKSNTIQCVDIYVYKIHTYLYYKRTNLYIMVQFHDDYDLSNLII
jgi:hypothetical protein